MAHLRRVNRNQSHEIVATLTLFYSIPAIASKLHSTYGSNFIDITLRSQLNARNVGNDAAVVARKLSHLFRSNRGWLCLNGPIAALGGSGKLNFRFDRVPRQALHRKSVFW